MKKSISILLISLIVFTFCFLAAASGSDSEDTKQEGETAAADTASENALGKYEVEIKGSRMTTDYEGKPVIVITYNFKNNGDSDATFGYAIDYKAFQNGVELDKAYVLKDGDKYNDDNQYKAIKKDVALDIEVAYKLNDRTTDVDAEVKELISLDDKTISKTFTIKK